MIQKHYYRPQTKFGARIYFHKRVSRIMFMGGGGGAIPACIAGGIPACLAAGLRGVLSQHALQVVSQHALQQVSKGGWYPSMHCSRSRRGGCLLQGGLLWGEGGLLPGGLPGGDPPGWPSAAGGTHPTGMPSCRVLNL